MIKALAFAGAAPAASAQTAPSSGDGSTNSLRELPEVVVRDRQEPSYKVDSLSSPKYTEPLRDIPQSVSVIPQTLIEAQAASSLRDVLRNVPGISLQAGEGGGGLAGDNLSIRGFNARSDVFIDGIRDFGAYSRDPFNLEQVEVTKGPTSATSGRGATGGSINLVTKTPRLTPLYGGTAGLGTDDYRRATLDFNQPMKSLGLGTSAIRLNALWHESGIAGRDLVEDERWAINPSIAFGLGTSTRLFLDYLHMDQDNVPQYGLPWVPAGNTNAILSQYIDKAPPVDFSNFYGLKNYDFEDIRNDTVTATFEHDFNDTLRLRNVSRYGNSFRNHAITAPRFVDLDPATPGSQSDTLVNRQLQRRRLEHSLFANVTDVTVDFATGRIEHSLVGGLEVSREDQDNRNSAQATNQPQTDIFNPVPTDLPLGPMPPITGVPNEAVALTVAPYVFDTLKFGEKWQLHGGLRWDYVDSRFQSGGNRLARTDSLPSGNAGIVFKPRPQGSIYFAYGTSFIPAIAAGNAGLGLSTNDVSLDPEKTHSYELGTKWDFFQDKLSLNLALFRTEKTNARTQGLNPGDPPLVLDGEQVVQGVEIGVAGNLTPEWSVYAGYTYMDTEITESNNAAEVGSEINNAPPHSFNLWTSYRLPWDLEVGFGTQYVGDRRNGNTSAARVAPEYWLFDAMLSYEVSEHFTLRLSVYNLADNEYIDRVGGGHFIPGAGRSAIVTAQLSF